ncbi:MAG: NifU family protein, partial [Mucilaginibacter sp.]
ELKVQLEEQAEVNFEGTDAEVKIQQILQDYVRPAVEQDGGAIHYKSFQDGVVTVELRGSCSGCPSSTVTLKAGIENLLKRMVPEVTEVVSEAM